MQWSFMPKFNPTGTSGLWEEEFVQISHMVQFNQLTSGMFGCGKNGVFCKGPTNDDEVHLISKYSHLSGC